MLIPHCWASEPWADSVNIRVCTLLCKQPVQSRPDTVVFPETSKANGIAGNFTVRWKHAKQPGSLPVSWLTLPCLPGKLPGSGKTESVRLSDAASGISSSLWSAHMDVHLGDEQPMHAPYPSVNLHFLKRAPPKCKVVPCLEDQTCSLQACLDASF